MTLKSKNRRQKITLIKTDKTETELLCSYSAVKGINKYSQIHFNKRQTEKSSFNLKESSTLLLYVFLI